MTVAYSINSGSEIHGVTSTWRRVPTRIQEDGEITYNAWAINEWSIPLLTITNFETLKAAEGDTITSLETNDIDDINSGATYTTVILESLVNGSHVGLHMENVRVTFRVDWDA